MLQATRRYVVVVVESMSVRGLCVRCIRLYISLCIMLVQDHTVPLSEDNDLFMAFNLLVLRPRSKAVAVMCTRFRRR